MNQEEIQDRLRERLEETVIAAEAALDNYDEIGDPADVVCQLETAISAAQKAVRLCRRIDEEDQM